LKDLSDKIRSFGDALHDQIDAFGKGAEAAQRFKLAREGATAADLAGVDAALKQLDVLKENKELHDDAQRVIEETQSPLEKFNERLGKLGVYLSAGEITVQQYATALAKDYKDLMPKASEEHAPAALLEGTAGAYSAEVAFERQGQGGNVQEQIKQGIDKMVESQKQIESLGRQIARAVIDITGVNPF
jgi:hypothetical protein